ncbi:MAG: glycosyltransferase [Anaerolineae bacterium]|nr:glycosyltransferase [Anaerolineae bacterium]
MTPFFSIIIPTYARPRQLETCLHALAQLDYPRDRFEVIVVDDGSEAPPEAIVAAFHQQLDVTLLSPSHAGPAAARNTGAGRARGEFLAFTDDDCRPAPDWLHVLAAHLAGGVHAVGGRTINALEDNVYSTASQWIVDMVYAHFNADPTQARFFATNNLAVPAAAFRAVGGFDGAHFIFASEDRDFCDRWLHHGQRLVYAPQAIVYHAHPLSLRSFWRQHLSYGRGAFRFHRARARRNSGQIRNDISFHAHLPALIRRTRPPGRIGRQVHLLSLLAVWQLANAVGYFLEYREQ